MFQVSAHPLQMFFRSRYLFKYVFFSCSYFSLKSSVTRVELDTHTHKGLLKFERWDLVFIHGLFKYSKLLPHSVTEF